MNQEQRTILFELALSSGRYETEYDGRTYIFCAHCDANLENQEHESDCLITRAQQALGSEWTEYVHEQEQIQQAAQTERAKQLQEDQQRERERRERQAHLNRKVECDLCGSTVSAAGLDQHKSSLRCRRKQQGISRSEARAAGFATCKQCGTDMPGAHYNRQFCSNTGAGNCKDAFHNARPARAQKAWQRLHNNLPDRLSDINDFDEVHLEFDPSWDAHKDSF